MVVSGFPNVEPRQDGQIQVEPKVEKPEDWRQGSGVIVTPKSLLDEDVMDHRTDDCEQITVIIRHKF